MPRSDASGAPVAGAKVVVTSTTMGIKTTAVTDKKGIYSFMTLLPGASNLEVEAKGFKPANRKGPSVHVDSAIKMDLPLEAGEEGTGATK
jgi:uncharacterized protein YfaS (alpha-2-macroglobulin family)